MPPSKICLFVGRFQPFHNGHLSVLKGMVKVCSKVVVGIGSSDGVMSDNPFTTQERREMIQRALQDVDIIPAYDVELVDMPDETDDEAWARRCVELAGGEVSAVWTGNEWTKKCFASIDVRIQEIKEVPGISAAEVRRRMLDDESWEELVPEEVAGYIKEIDGAPRVKNLASD